MNENRSRGELVGNRRFRLEERLGEGGFGEVWRATDTLVSGDVALKFVRADKAGEGAGAALWKEANQSRKLTHPGIARIYDVCEFADEAGFIVMEFVDGEPLSVKRAKQPHGNFAWEEIEALVVQLCDALEYAHGKGVVHRDIKPANMMVTGAGVLKLTDFGLAAPHDSEGARGGSPPYMSPQQLRGMRPTMPDDVYSVGAVIYELLCGKPPFYRGDIDHQIRHQMPEPLAERMADLEMKEQPPPAVAAIVMACLAKEPDRRPAGVAAIREWLNLPQRTAEEMAEAEAASRPEPMNEGVLAGKKPAFIVVGSILGLLVLLAVGYFLFG